MVAMCILAGRFAIAENLPPLFKVGKPTWRSFSTTTSGYGALGDDQAHVAVYVPLAESKRVRPGAEADVRLGSPDGLVSTVTGHVTSVLSDADPRTGQAIVSIQIPSQSLPPRTYVSASVQLNARRALAIPSTAILWIEGQPFVFKQDDKNDFDKTPVKIGEPSPDYTELQGGLKETDNILIKGAMEWSYKDKTGGEE